MTYLAASQFLLIVGLIWQLDRRHTREVQTLHVLDHQYAVERGEQQQHFADLTTQVLARFEQPHPDLHELTGIVDRLCQRIQAPELAVTEHAMAQPLPEMPQPALPDDDEAFWTAHGYAPESTKEELAVALDG